MFEDDEVDRPLFHARPPTPLRGERLGETQEALLHRITQESDGLGPEMPRGPPQRAIAGIAVSVMDLIMVVVFTAVGV